MPAWWIDDAAVEYLVGIRIRIREAKTLQIRITAIIHLLGELTSLVGAVEDLVRIRIREDATLQIRITAIIYLLGELTSLVGAVEDLVGIRIRLSEVTTFTAILYLLGELTSLVGAVEDLVVEYGEVEGEAQPDGVGGLHLALADIKCILETKTTLL
jgi:hypothetical protein